ncbi:MAG: diphosphate--fructose-6-phosphate 1-phosphotransferase [Myxococcota bacterium]|nr:diphosphate--fructose-6-phosphate 1-phosphotransferase [Myxococcota bacterium]
MATFGIVVGGGPAPGINGVIGAATILARREGAKVVGIVEGFRWLMEGNVDHTLDLRIGMVSRVHLLGGSILQTSRANPTKQPGDLERVVESLEKLGIDHLITIGGDDTAFSARRVAETAEGRIRVAHVPKTIDNDLPLPGEIPTFGFETAREHATRLISHLMEDARTTQRWYLAVVMGRKAGHLALGAAKAAGATVCLIPEDMGPEKLRLARVVGQLEGAVVKRLSMGRGHGVAVLAEGIGELLDPEDLEGLSDAERDEHGHVRLQEVPLGTVLRKELRKSLGELGIKMAVVEKDIGYELRCAQPNAFDLDYTRDLGAGAVRTLLDGTSGVMITRQGSQIVPIPFDEMLDEATGKTRIRMVDTSTQSHQSAFALQVRMEPADFESEDTVAAIGRVTGLDADGVRKRYGSD